MIRRFTRILSDEGFNIANMANKSRGDFAYTVIDLETPVNEQIMTKIEATEGVLKARVITR